MGLNSELTGGLLAVGPEALGFLAIGENAVGVIAVGNTATGVVAIGTFARGVVAIGVCAIGFISLSLGAGIGAIAWGCGILVGGLVRGLGLGFGLDVQVLGSDDTDVSERLGSAGWWVLRYVYAAIVAFLFLCGWGLSDDVVADLATNAGSNSDD